MDKKKPIDPLEEMLKETKNLKDDPIGFANSYRQAYESVHLIKKSKKRDYNPKSS